MEALTYLMYIAAALVAFKLIVLGWVWRQLVRMRCQFFQSTFIDQADISAELAPIFEEAHEILTGLGFTYSHTLLQGSFYVGQDATPCQVYIHTKTKTCAQVSPSKLPAPSQPFNLSFSTRFTDGGTIETLDCMLHAELPWPPSCEAYDHYCGNPQQQWEKHKATIQAAAGRRPVLGSAAQLLEAHNQDCQNMVAYGLETGWLKPAAAPDQWRLNSWTALKKACQALIYETKRVKALKAGRKTDAPTSPARLAADISAYEHLLEAVKPRASSWVRKTVLFVLSAAGAYVAFGLVVSWQVVPLWLGILFVHELGHLVAMWLCGYQNRQIFFLPFLGAATTGYKEDATPMQEIFVSLMGPMPGLIFGLWCLYAMLASDSTEGFWYGLAWTAILLNYLNLLPVFPLDGGRVVQALFGSRLPRLQFGFMLFSTLVFAAAAWWSKEPILFIFAGAFAVTLPSIWQSSVLTARVARLISPQADKTERLRVIAQTVEETAKQSKLLATRFGLVQTLMQRFAAPPPTWRTQIGGGICYGLALLTPLWVGGVYAITLLPDEDRLSHLSNTIYTLATG
ncbi:site-2 protease family protein, partial [Candidatus Entotheonella palauensis]|uniref:site-2 protease family protein n=1 Tax=Candidatus Entotheonella palauensis TaxID=93172 RepID=UPI0015C45F31